MRASPVRLLGTFHNWEATLMEPVNTDIRMPNEYSYKEYRYKDVCILVDSELWLDGVLNGGNLRY